jgi:serine/threonine protein kinase
VVSRSWEWRVADRADSGEILDSRPPKQTSINPDLPAGGQVVGGYRLLEQIGAGGFSIVWKARHEATGQIVALKFPRVPEFVAHLTREALISSRLPHSNVVPVLEAHLDHDPPYLVSPFIIGRDLQLPEEAPPPAGIVKALEQFYAIAAVVDGLHHEDIVHGDLKPGNLRIDPRGACYVLDLGLARHHVTLRQRRPFARPSSASPARRSPARWSTWRRR